MFRRLTAPASRLRIAAVTLALMACVPATAGADTFVVNRSDDVAGAAGCPVVCTIRNAIGAAAGNGNAVADVIAVPAGSYTLNGQLGTLSVPTGSTGITIDGAGANTTFIQPNPEVPIRVLNVGTGAGVTLSDITVRNGLVSAAGEYGGNIRAQSGAALTVLRARVTEGRALRGGGIATQGAASLTVSASLIDANRATAATLNDSGGGIHVEGQTSATVVTIQDSTITGNLARNGGGIGVVNNTGQNPALRGVTLTRNTAVAGVGIGVGGIYSQNTTARLQGSIVGGNISTINLSAGTQDIPANCAVQGAPIDDGGNVSFDATEPCGLGGVHADPQLAAALDGSQPPALAIGGDSSAVDIAACGGRTFDQRGVLRPQGLTCDAGAYEYQPPVVEPTPTPTPTASPQPTATPVPTATPSPAPTPVVNRTVVVREESGTVLIRRAGSSRFEPLGGALGVPVGSTVDARRGVVVLTSIPRAGGTPETARFWDGIFKVTQSRGITTLTLTEALAPCSNRALAAQKKPKTRKLWGDGKGKFRTKGRYSAATVRGTKWLVTDGCRYTRTRVVRGSVLVRDEVRKRNIIVRSGKTYTARARR